MKDGKGRGAKRRGPTPRRAAAGGRSTSEKVEATRLDKLHDLRRRKLCAGSLFGAAGIVAASHVAEHLGAFTVWRPGADDILVGYPTAIGLLIAGAVKLGPR